MEDMFHIQVEDEIFGEGWLECFATEILGAKYERTDVAGKIIRCSLELLEFIHTKRYTLTLIQMPSLYILGHTLYLKSI